MADNPLFSPTQLLVAAKALQAQANILVAQAQGYVDAAPLAGTVLAAEGQSFTLVAPTRVRYGSTSNALWFATDLPPGTYEAKAGTVFTDPAPNATPKSVVSLGPARGTLSGLVTVPVTTSPPPPAPPPSQPGITNEWYVAMASKLCTDEGIEYRFGPPSSATGITEHWFEPQHIPFPLDPYQPGGVVGGRPINRENAGTYEIGTWKSDVSQFSSNWGHLLFVSENATYFGAADILINTVSNSVLCERPEIPWMYWGEYGFNAKHLADQKKKGLVLKRPVCEARSHGRPGWGVSSVVVFEDGLVINEGSNTQNNEAYCRLPANLKPSAIALTNSNEFAFITCWDTDRFKGVVAVVAMAGIADGVKWDAPRKVQDWGEWYNAHPGLSNIGNIAFMKFVGTVDLPDNCKCPTDVSATTGADRYGAYLSQDGGDPNSDAAYNRPLENETFRQQFVPGGILRRFAKTTGQVWVTSKTEKTAVLLDISPLLSYYDTMYFSTKAKFDETTKLGFEANQWPYAFSVVDSQKPTVAKTMTLPDSPTAVKAYQFGDLPNVWIATLGGTVYQYDCKTGAAKGSVNVGPNPTALELAKEKSFSTVTVRLYPDYVHEMLVTVRGERAVKWIRWTNTGGTIVRTLKDDRIKDPITACDTDNQGSELYIVTVVDYSGKMVHNYRFGGFVLSPDFKNNTIYGMGSDGKAPFEYGGGIAIPGKPFALCSSNTS